jgi:hypothetical protein
MPAGNGRWIPSWPRGVWPTLGSRCVGGAFALHHDTTFPRCSWLTRTLRSGGKEVGWSFQVLRGQSVVVCCLSLSQEAGATNPALSRGSHPTRVTLLQGQERLMLVAAHHQPLHSLHVTDQPPFLILVSSPPSPKIIAGQPASQWEPDDGCDEIPVIRARTIS